MQNKSSYVAGVAVAVTLIVLASRSAVSAGQTGALVRLQPANPGVAQVGNANITGNMKVGVIQSAGFKLGAGSTAGFVLTTDALGVGNWAAPDLILPYVDTGVANNTVGLFRIINNGSNSAIEGRNDSGAFGKLGGDNYGVYGESGTTFNYGSLGNSDNGVAGSNNVASTYGYIGGTQHGVWGESGEAGGAAIYGRNFSTSGLSYGGFFTTANVNGYGLWAQNTTANNALTYAGYFKVNNSNAGIGVRGDTKYVGVWGTTSLGTGLSYGGYFDASSPGARGVYATVDNSASTDYGVRGQAGDPSDYAVYAVGDTGASGNKAFRIDHPQDPYNKYLKHYSAEGPLPMNVYSGLITTNANGIAVVELPSYYESVNKNPRYTLTVVDEGEDFVMAKVSRRLAGRTFEVRTSKPNVEVSWMIQAERNDAWNQQYPPVTEEEKVGAERGKLQVPALYGQPESMGMDPKPDAVRKNK